MTTHVLAVLGLGVACGLWIVVQRFVAAHDPEQPGVEGSKGCSGGGGHCSCGVGDGGGSCENR